MPDEEKFKIIVKGYLPDKGEYYVEKDFAKQFKITEEKAKHILRSAPNVIKKDLCKDEAEKFVLAIRKLGVDCEVESMRFDFSGLSLE